MRDFLKVLVAFLLFVPMAGFAKGYWYFTPLSIDVSPSYVGVQSVSWGIGIGRFIIGTSALECKRFPGVPKIPGEWNGDCSVELLPFYLYLNLLHHKSSSTFQKGLYPKALTLYGYYETNWREIKASTWNSWYHSYYYSRIGIGATLGHFVRLSVGYFSGGYKLGKAIKSEALYATIGIGAPDLWGEWRITRPPESFPPLHVVICQAAGGLVVTYLCGFICGFSPLLARVVFDKLGGAIYTGSNGEICYMEAGMFSGCCFGYATGVSAVGKLFRMKGSWGGSIMGAMSGLAIGTSLAYISKGNLVCVGVAVGLPVIGSFIGFYMF